MSIQAYLDGLTEAEQLFVSGAFAPAEAVLSTALRGRTPDVLGAPPVPSATETDHSPVFSVIVDGDDCGPILHDLAAQGLDDYEVLRLCRSGEADFGPGGQGQGGPSSGARNADALNADALNADGRHADGRNAGTPQNGDHSTDGQGADRLRCLTPPPGLPLAEARNLAALRARGSVLVFLDGACRVDADFLEQIARGFADHDVLALRGRLLPRTPSPLNYRQDRYDPGDTPAASSLDVRSGFAVVRDVLLRFGGFGPLLTETHGRELAFRIHGEFGQGAVAYLPSVRVRRNVAPNEDRFVAEEARARLEEQYLCAHRPGFCGTLADQGTQGLAPLPRASSMFSLTPRQPAPYGEKDFELGLMLRQRESFAALADHFKDARLEPFSSLLTSALLHQRKLDELRAVLDELPASTERQLKIRTAELLPAIDSRMAAMAEGAEPRVHVLLLCWNRAEYVREAVRQLGNTDYRNWALYVADNGSTDGTWEQLQAGLAELPKHVDVHVERFPMNIGRPVGHDWLLTRFDHSASDFIAIADDDLFHIPATWLRHMVATAQAVPRAGVVGGKAYGEERPRLIHGAVRDLLWYDRDDFVLSHGRDRPDYGQLDHIAFTDHVIGCLHIYRTEVFFDAGDRSGHGRVGHGRVGYDGESRDSGGKDHRAAASGNAASGNGLSGNGALTTGASENDLSDTGASENAAPRNAVPCDVVSSDAAPGAEQDRPAPVGLFDIGLSPCQMVDVDHHLRCRLAGWQVVYNGLVEFGHARQGGKTAQTTSAKLGNVLGNQVKVLYKHDPEAVREMLDRAARTRQNWLETGQLPEE